MSEPLRRYRGQTWVDPRQSFRPSPTQGIGSFALAPICEGEAIKNSGVRLEGFEPPTRGLGNRCSIP